MYNLSGHIALVTGGSRGLGRATAFRLAENGARVIVHYGGNREAAEAVVAQIRGDGGQADAIGVDLATADGAHRLAEAVRALGVNHLDVVVASAGIAEPALLEQQTVEAFDRHFAINVRAPFFLVQQLLPLLGEASSIIFLSSAGVRIAIDGMSVYSATKGAVNVLVRGLAKELGPRGIRVNAISPGAIDTDMGQVLLSTEEGREMIKELQALKRIGQPDDVADVALFLASHHSRWVTGESLDTSGGSQL
jgi:NAD(P)-dependent dehydrogenase (short-subunit alcohol dehydrogenase family)